MTVRQAFVTLRQAIRVDIASHAGIETLTRAQKFTVLIQKKHQLAALQPISLSPVSMGMDQIVAIAYSPLKLAQSSSFRTQGVPK